MASNYPPGVTGNEPQIAGVKHYRQCPLHEDNPIEHSCGAQNIARAVIEWDSDWYLVLNRRYSHQRGIRIRIDFCPYCGEELPKIRCKCAEIKEGLHEQALGL